jgi:hypothetical protein
MKIKIPYNGANAEIKLDMSEHVARIKKICGNQYASIKLEFSQYAAGGPIIETVVIYNGRTGFTPDCNAIEEAFGHLERIAGPQALKLRAEQLRQKAAELEAAAEKFNAEGGVK